MDDRRRAEVEVVHPHRELPRVLDRLRLRHAVALLVRLEHLGHRAAHQFGEHGLVARLEARAEEHADVRVAELAQDRALHPQVAQRQLLVLGAALRLEHLCRHRRAAPPRLEDVAERAGATFSISSTSSTAASRPSRAACRRPPSRRASPWASMQNISGGGDAGLRSRRRVDERLRDVGVAVALGVVQGLPQRSVRLGCAPDASSSVTTSRWPLLDDGAARSGRRSPRAGRATRLSSTSRTCSMSPAAAALWLDRRLLADDTPAGAAVARSPRGGAAARRRRRAPPVGAELGAVLVEQQLDDGELALEQLRAATVRLS